jgi:hypothetical protein
MIYSFQLVIGEPNAALMSGALRRVSAAGTRAPATWLLFSKTLMQSY